MPAIVPATTWAGEDSLFPRSGWETGRCLDLDDVVSRAGRLSSTAGSRATGSCATEGFSISRNSGKGSSEASSVVGKLPQGGNVTSCSSSNTTLGSGFCRPFLRDALNKEKSIIAITGMNFRISSMAISLIYSIFFDAREFLDRSALNPLLRQQVHESTRCNINVANIGPLTTKAPMSGTSGSYQCHDPRQEKQSLGAFPYLK